MTTNSLIPVILCGGTGTRLWPLSRASYPKQYLALNTNSKQSLLQQTQERLKGLKNLKNPLLLCNEDHRFIVAEQMRQINIKPEAIILEPIGRNTAPAITVAALKATEAGTDPLLLILSADHEIRDEKEFLRVIQAGTKYANAGRLVTFGIVPKSAETGYGYIEAKTQLVNKELVGIPIEKFIEKPKKETAEQLIQDPRFTWNSGMFLFKASVILSELTRLMPDMVNACKQALEEDVADLDFLRLDKKSFMKCPNISIDIAIMEKTQLGTVLPLNAGWNDVGSWNTLWKTAEKNTEGNLISGKVIAENSKNCYLRSENRLIVGLGIEDLIIVETNDAVLVAHRNQAQNIRNIVQKLDQQGRPEGKTHTKIYRPWGHYTSIVTGSRWQIKLIEVKPNASLSLQMHHHRAEHWVIVKGTALIEKDGKKELLSENESTFIPLGCKHRLSNPGKMPLELVEIQSGAYLNEDDIIRFEDSYGRLNHKT